MLICDFGQVMEWWKSCLIFSWKPLKIYILVCAVYWPEEPFDCRNVREKNLHTVKCTLWCLCKASAVIALLLFRFFFPACFFSHLLFPFLWETSPRCWVAKAQGFPYSSSVLDQVFQKSNILWSTLSIVLFLLRAHIKCAVAIQVLSKFCTCYYNAICCEIFLLDSCIC